MKSVLIANRGEIACRIAEACRKRGLRSIAAYSEADANARHVILADEAVEIGPAPARRSYLDQDAILAAAKASGADAIHPGYGFLSENAGFAQRVSEAGVIWIGPSAQTISLMGNKEQARLAAEAAGVPLLPGTQALHPEDDYRLEEVADGVGYPLLVKAVAGGGGMGMRLVEDRDTVRDAVDATRHLAERTFGDPKVYFEGYIARARHIEIQVFGTGTGKVCVFPERDCSVQRRFQKIVEESPAPGLSAMTRQKMQDAAAALAGSQNYAGAGTVEFVMDEDTGQFFFLEMNTRIQVEHPVTEVLTDTDLVDLQLRLASGEDLNLPDRYACPIDRHVIEVRVCAESPEQGFVPKPGELTRFDVAKDVPGIRVDTGVSCGDVITPFYDSMIAKVIASGSHRAEALSSLLTALSTAEIAGPPNNVSFLRAVLKNGDFSRGGATTRFVEANLSSLLEDAGVNRSEFAGGSAS